MRHVILFGGSFDPIHYGHLEIAKAALASRNADELWFIPTKRSPFKTDSTSFDDRKHMIEMMISGLKKMSVNSVESMLPEPSYSIDTVSELKKQYPDYTFDWLIGSDQLPRMHEWKQFDMLKDSVQFIVYNRGTEHLTTDYPIISGSVFPYSSTKIREGKSMATKPSILRYMTEQSLYMQTLNSANLTPNRAEHVFRVVALAQELARAHNVDYEAVTLAAYAHDLKKETDKEDLRMTMQAKAPHHEVLHPAFYHAFAAKYLLTRKYYIKNKHVLQAIEGHVDGHSTNPVGMILYIADKCERGRSWDSEPFIELAKQDLRKGFKALRKYQREFEQAKGNLK